MKVGVSLPTNGPLASPEALRAVAIECDRLGYDSIWATDHTTWTAAFARQNFQVGSVDAWREPVEPNYFEPLITMAHQAAAEARAAETLRVLAGAFTRPDSAHAGRAPDFRFVGDPKAILPRAAAYQEAGFEHLALRVIARDLPEVLDSLAMLQEQVLDQLPP